ncbi:universal stress protein [Prauserella flavalba]|uniref:Universal stress protein n=1 Tax=Prauserella flavalba TaxID=1477506 RepID=A0A318MCE4_9PSEU|nr:universal stress protein [Prauserella flavalba]PXY36539.1 universal stress protein [Prauserella flavalba]
MTDTDTIVSGVDGSASALHAAAWAAAEAERHGARLRLVHAYLVPDHGYPGFLATAHEVREGLRKQGEGWLREAKEAAEKAAPGVEVETALTEKLATTALLGESRGATLVVLGSRGLGGFSGLPIGSVAVALAAHGECPVIVVRGKRPDDVPPTEGPVVVGIDESEASRLAVEFAFAEAARRRVPLVAVHVWNDVTLEATVRMYPLTIDPADVDAREGAMLEEQLADCRQRYPDVTVEAVVERGRPVRTLLELGERAQLVVVGSRGRGGFTGMLLGSTSRTLVVHAPCPVAVVRPQSTGKDVAP